MEKILKKRVNFKTILKKSENNTILKITLLILLILSISTLIDTIEGERDENIVFGSDTINNSTTTNISSLNNNSTENNNSINNNSINYNKTINTIYKVISQNNIIKGSKALYNYLDNKRILPTTIVIDKKTYSTGEFLYLMSKTIVNKYNNNKKAITINFIINNNDNIKGNTIKSKFSSKTYYKIAKYIVNYVETYHKLPSYYKLSNGKKIKYETLVF
ncbi:MAG: hypothetical protein LBR24_02315, partial [Methanobrevibacter sp.]|nr:hypothetical protein [Methanobrevibacter sp.]